MFRKKHSNAKTSTRRQPVATQGGKTKTVFSYYSGSARLSGSPAADTNGNGRKSRSAKARLWRAFVGVLALVAVASVIYSLLVSDRPVVELGQNPASQALLQKPEVYAQAATKLIESSPFNLNKLTFDAAGLSRELESQFNEIADVTVVLPLVGHDPVLHIEPFEPKMVLVDGNNAFVLDKQGRAQSDSTSISGLDRLELPVVKDESGLPMAPGQLVLSKEHVSFISDVAYQLKAKNVDIANMTLPPGGSELVVQAKDTPYVVRFNLYGEARGQAGQYLAAKQYFESHDEPSEYVDARVDNRVYYR